MDCSFQSLSRAAAGSGSMYFGFIPSQLLSQKQACCINYVECFYNTHLTTGIAWDIRSGKFCHIPRTTSSLSRCVDLSIETATQRHWMPVAAEDRWSLVSPIGCICL
ncbi:hypothetical protein H6G96_29015 [Nostoc sp. FACHB-892]|uniref:hypothetical protein n=1 Tax=Nostoc sp. FACHB-892 TaxID=2692843 RepID=UPI0016888CF4|nr:hypothetical protein [Nostoc sp. FACHB-892]MBD2730247.1 hypothetical protein [Nostoc sp. FACHB-892]